MPARNPIPAPRLITIHPAPIAEGIISVRAAEPVIFIPAIAVPVAVVMLMPLMPLIPLIPLMTSPLDIVMETSIDISLMPGAIEEPVAATAAAAAAVGSLSHIMVTTSAPDAVAVADGFDVMPDCARAIGASARSMRVLGAAKDLECILAELSYSFRDQEAVLLFVEVRKECGESSSKMEMAAARDIEENLVNGYDLKRTDFYT